MGCFYATFSVDSKGKDEMSCGAEETPAMVYTGLGQKIEALTQPSLYTGETNFSCF